MIDSSFGERQVGERGARLQSTVERLHRRFGPQAVAKGQLPSAFFVEGAPVLDGG